MDALHFDPTTHCYTYGDRELISVTQVLSEAGFIDRQWYTDAAATRGTAVHAAVQGFHEHGSVPSDDVCAPFFDAYLKFQAEGCFVVVAAEERVCDLVRGYAGTLDLRGSFPRFGRGVDLIDIKTGSVPSWVGYQTAAYARLVSGCPVRRWALNLKATGAYKLEPLTSRTDEQVFLAALTVVKAKRGWL